METPQAPSGRPGSRRILIVGGGTAGWMTAGYLAKLLGSDATGGPRITLVESSDIGIIGVGEGTFPTIRNTLRLMGLDEAEFLRDSHATFKQGIRFDDWEVTPRDGVHSHYFHPFEQPFVSKEEISLLHYWLLQDPKTRPPFAQAVTFQKRLADASMAPKQMHQGQFHGPLNYAYHFDATKLAMVLAKHARGLGVHHLTGTVSSVTLGDDGAIAGVVTPEHGELTADLYIDCTGFRSELLGKALGVPFKDIKDTLFTDRAVALQVPYDSPDSAIPSYTISTAHEAGWTWDIGLDQRRGIGYVYSSLHSDDDRAEQVLRDYIGPKAEGLTARRIQFKAGYRMQQWVKNCVAVGLSAGFLEPLESTGVVLIEAAIKQIADLFPHTGAMDAPATAFNELMVRRYESIIGFIKLHYCLSRRDEPFWRDNTDPASIPERLQYLLEQWKHRPPSRYDFTLDHEAFAHFSYQYILYGLNYPTDFTAAAGCSPQQALADELFERIVIFGEQAARDLPTHRALVTSVYERGFVDPRALKPHMAMNFR